MSEKISFEEHRAGVGRKRRFSDRCDDESSEDQPKFRLKKMRVIIELEYETREEEEIKAKKTKAKEANEEEEKAFFGNEYEISDSPLEDGDLQCIHTDKRNGRRCSKKVDGDYFNFLNVAFPASVRNRYQKEQLFDFMVCPYHLRIMKDQVISHDDVCLVRKHFYLYRRKIQAGARRVFAEGYKQEAMERAKRMRLEPSPLLILGHEVKQPVSALERMKKKIELMERERSM